MTTKVEKSIRVGVPIDTAYGQWTQFEEFPQFMHGISEVRQITDATIHWVAEIKGVRREWDATILEQVPNEKIAWAAVAGATNAGAVYFTPAGDGETIVRLVLEYEPEGVLEQLGEWLGVVEKQAEGDLERFKEFIEARGRESGYWPGEVPGTHIGTPGIKAAMVAEGDSGKPDLPTAVKAAGAAATAAVTGVLNRGEENDDETGGAEASTGSPVQELPAVSTSPYAANPDAAYPTGEGWPSPVSQDTQSS